MSYLPIKSSTPVDLKKVSRSEAFEFFPDHLRLDSKDAKKSIIFLKRDKIDSWKYEAQRDKIFQSISNSESSLKSRTIVTIRKIYEDSCSYSYRENGKIVRKTIALAPDEEVTEEEVIQEFEEEVFEFQGPIPDPIPTVSPKNAQCYYKVSELSLRQFKQIELSNSLIEGLKAVLEFLATPFVALYRLAAGTEAREFAKMLNPIQHDRVGELTHDDVLNQVRFVGQFFAESDTVQYDIKSELKTEKQRLIRYEGNDCPVEKRTDKNGKSYQAIYTEETKFVPFFPYHEALAYKYVGDKPVAPLYQFNDVNQVLFEGKWYNYRFVMKGDQWVHEMEMPVKFWKPLAINKNEVFYKGAVRSVRKREVVNSNLSKWDPDRKKTFYEIDLDGDWKEIQKLARFNWNINFFEIEEEDGEKHQLEVIRNTFSTRPEEDNRNLTEKQKAEEEAKILKWTKPVAESAVQKAGSIFREGYCVGKAIHEACNQDDQRAIKAISAQLNQDLANIEEKKVMMLPLAQGEGGDYLPNFLMFVDVPAVYHKPIKGMNGPPHIKTPRKVLMKHICFSSTSLDKGKREAITTYDITDSIKDDLAPFFRTLIANHPVSRARDAKVVNTPGPIQRDDNLQRILLGIGQPIVEGKAVPLTRASRDPVKALFTIVHELGSLDTSVKDNLTEISASKASFYKFYVDQLTAYYEENEAKLNGAERVRALEGIQHYATKVRHYMEKELGVDAARSITEHFLKFVEKKLGELKRTEALEKQDVEKLQSSAQLFWAKIAEPINQTVQFKKTTSNEIEEARVPVDAILRVEKLRMQLTNLVSTKDERQATFDIFNDLIQKAKNELKGNPKAAKKRLVAIMQALPPPNGLTTQTFWTWITIEEITQWNKALATLSESLFEAAARTGKFPLPPSQEIFDFHTVIPLIKRVLFERIIPTKVAQFTAAWNAAVVNPANTPKLKERTQEFIAMREDQIKKEETKKLKKIWDDEDRFESRMMTKYYADAAAHPFRLAAWAIEKRGEAPVLRDMPVRVDRSAERKAQLAKAIDDAKNDDLFLNELKAVRNALNAGAPLIFDQHTAGPRITAVMGCFAKIMDISPELLAYKVGGGGWGQKTLSYRDEDRWLLKKDLSFVPGSSPALEKRYEACKKTLEELKNTPFTGDELGLNLVIGYDGLGDGTMIEKGTEFYNLKNEINNYQNGYFDEGKGKTRFVPEEVAICSRDIAMRKILHKPKQYLKYHDSGAIAAVQNFFAYDLTPNLIRKKLSEMPSVYLAASGGCFTLSTYRDSPGNIGTNGQEEIAPTHHEQSYYLGQSSVDMCERTVGGDDERDAYGKFYNAKLFPDLDPTQAFILSVGALTKSAHPQELSYLAVSQCIHFIYQYPVKLSVPAVQHTLYKTLFHHDLIRKMLINNPTFFVTQGRILNEICLFLEKNSEYKKCGLFLREVCERIRRHAMDLEKEQLLDVNMGESISKELPPYNAQLVLATAQSKMDTSEQKEYAQYILAYYCHLNDGCKLKDDGTVPADFKGFPNPQATLEWKQMLTAFYLMQKSKREIGHTGWQSELITAVETKLIPQIAHAINQSPELRNELLDLLETDAKFKSSQDEGRNWTSLSHNDYGFSITNGTETLEIDIRTGMNCSPKPQNGERCKLPECIKSDPNFKFLFSEWNPEKGWNPKENWDPTTVCKPSADGTVVEYSWTSEMGAFKFRHRLEDNSIQILQTVNNKTYPNKTYRFQQLQVSEGTGSIILKILARSSNQTLEEMIATKGIWVPEGDQPEKTQPLVAQYGCNITKEPIHLKIVDNNILEATIGEGNEKMWICSSLTDQSTSLLNCRDGHGILLLSKDKTHIDEIRFPPDKGSPEDPTRQEQLILKKSSQDPNRWVFKNREDWEWQLTDTHEYEHRFGKNWREYILPLKNRKTGEEEFWIFPHFLVGTGKKEGGVKFLRSMLDFVDTASPAALSKFDLPPEFDMDAIRAVVGAIENYEGGVSNCLELIELFMANWQMLRFRFDIDADIPPEAKKMIQTIKDKMLPILRKIISPRGIKYRKDNRTDSSSHAGFFYLAYVASKNKDWATASYYLDMMKDCGKSSNVEDIQQLQQMTLFLLGGDALTGDLSNFKSLLTAQSPMEAAFRAKFAAKILTLDTSLKTQHKQGLLDFVKDIPQEFLAGVDQAIIKALEAGGNEGLALVVKIGGAHFYQQYRSSLAENYQQIAEHGMLITKEEEAILTSDVVAMAAALAGSAFLEAKPEEDLPEIQPYQLIFPEPNEIKKMIKKMSHLTSSNGVWSIHNMHQDVGTYPKWENVLAHFWDYWDWIYREERHIYDISFLFREIPSQAPYREEVDTARKLLLILWNYSKKGRYTDLRKNEADTIETLLNKIQRIRLEMIDFAAMKQKSQDLKKEAALNPSAWAVGRAALAEGFYHARQFVSNFSYKRTVGGVVHKKSPRKTFIKVSEELLQTHLSNTTAGLGKIGHVLTLEGITKPKMRFHPKPLPKEDPQKIARQEAVNSFTTLIPKNMMNDELKAKMGAIFDLPYPIALARLKEIIGMIPRIDGYQKATELLTDSFFKHFTRVHATYTKAAGTPHDPYPEQIIGGEYEDVEIVLPNQQPSWGSYFVNSCEILNTTEGEEGKFEVGPSIWKKREEEALKKFDPALIKDGEENADRKKAKFTNICEGIRRAARDLEKRTGSSFHVAKLKQIHQEISDRLEGLKVDENKCFESVLHFARDHGKELGLLYLFADPYRFTDKQIFEKILDLYRYGQLGRLQDKDLQTYFAGMITETLLVATERQQHEKALGACRDLASVLRKIVKQVPKYIATKTRQNKIQNLANRDIDWILYSADLKRFLEEGSNRLRYADEGTHLLKDVFSRRYLVSDYQNGWTTRQKASTALEQMMKDFLTKTDEKGNPVRFIRAKMGTGKSDFVFPEAIRLFIQYGYQPLMITTDDLIPQLNASMGHKGFVFKFDINFGLEVGVNEDFEKKYSPLQIETHLSTLLTTLNQLKPEGKALLTSPAQLSGLANKRRDLQEKLRLSPPEKALILFKQLQLVKKIEACLEDMNCRRIIDEDVNYDISYEFNFASGEFRPVDAFRFDAAELMIYTIESKHPDLWDKMVNNNMRAIENVAAEFEGVVRSIFHDIDFWTSVGWDKATWEKINEDDFVNYILGKMKDPPEHMEWKTDLSDRDQPEKCFVAALKTYISQTLDSVHGVNPAQERGLSSSNNVTVVPFNKDDGKERVGVLYGEESEMILHHIFHYLGAGNKLGEDVFAEKEKGLASISNQRISPHRKETWNDWVKAINKGLATYRKKNPKATKFEAFMNSPGLALQRFQFLRYILTQNPEVRVYIEQIVFNSQDLGIVPDKVRLASGTGTPFGLNLADYIVEDPNQDPALSNQATDPDEVLGETLLCMDLKQSLDVFECTPLDYMLKCAGEEKCQAILNFDYEVMGNDSEAIAALLVQKGRQVIYRDKNLDKKIWNPDQCFATNYEPDAITDLGLSLYNRDGSRGLHFHNKRGGGKYARAMVGIGNLSDSIQQLVWRMRHLDRSGHEVEFACDMKTKAHILKASGVGEDRPPTTGEAWHYFILNSIEEEDVKNVKAVIFKSQTPAKTYLDKVVKGAYNEKDLTDTACLIDLEKKLFEVNRGLYIMNSSINWIREYQTPKQGDPIEFVQQLYAAEEKNLFQLNAKFNVACTSLYKDHPGLNEILSDIYVKQLLADVKHSKQYSSKLEQLMMPQTKTVENLKLYYNSRQAIEWQECEFCELPVFEERLAKLFAQINKKYKPEELANAREVITKVHAYKLALQKTYQDIQAEKKLLIESPDKTKKKLSKAKQHLKPQEYQKLLEKTRLNDEAYQQLTDQERLKADAYQKFLCQNLPESIDLDGASGSGKEQRVQQQQQQQQKTQQNVEQQVTAPIAENTPTRPINFNFFQKVILKEAQFTKSTGDYHWGKLKYHFENNGHFLPLSALLEQEKDVVFPDEFKAKYQNSYISHRAWSLIKKIACNGAPAVEIMFVQVGRDFHTVIITPCEREQALATCMRFKRNPALMLQAPPAPGYTRTSAWNDFKAVFGEVYHSIPENLENNKAAAIKIFEEFLNAPSHFDAWAVMYGKLASLLNLIGLAGVYSIPGTKRFIDILFDSQADKFKEIYLKYQENLLASPPDGKIEQIAVYALSNENFSYLRMDEGEYIPNENKDKFIHQMVINKLYLNWHQFTLPEIDHLISFVDEEQIKRPVEFKLFLEDLILAGSAKMAEFLLALAERSKPSEKLSKSAILDPWMFQVVQRKLENNYVTYSEEERLILEQWFYGMSPSNMQIMINNYKTIAAWVPNYSLKMLERTKNKVQGVKRDEDLAQRMVKDEHNIDYPTLLQNFPEAIPTTLPNVAQPENKEPKPPKIPKKPQKILTKPQKIRTQTEIVVSDSEED
jgi:hypothetical protein